MSDAPRRDPRRLFSPVERALIAARQHHACAVCNRDLPEVFHVHHVVPWAKGGQTHPDNGIAVCPDCHADAEIKAPDGFDPRLWQQEALPNLLPLLRAGEFATLSAAPGAGKTEMTAWLFSNLRDAGDCARLVIFVPNSHLRTQWKDVCATRGIYLRADSVSEGRGQDGVVITYAALLDPERLQQLIDDAADTPTLFVPDEVHHLAKTLGGDAGSWAVSIGRVVGTVDRPLHPVLNLSGTLFRSKPGERISTIRYRDLDGQIETVADYSVTAGRLIKERQLRHIKVLGYDAMMDVTAVDLRGNAHEGAETIRAVDLDGDGKLRSQILPGMVRDPQFIKGIVEETIDRLGHASIALEGAPVKGLIIADDIAHADDIHGEVARQIGVHRAFVAHGQINSADKEIERFRGSKEQAVMVAVQKVTEGFDVPDICVLTYLRTWRAPLFINQMVGRAMRITKREHKLKTYLPATVIVPNETEIKAAFADVLVGSMNILEAPPEPCPRCGREICACPPRPRRKICPVCQMPWMICTCTCIDCGLTKQTGCTCWRKPSPICNRCGKPERWCACPGVPHLNVTGQLELEFVNVDGNDVELHILESLKEPMAAIGLPLVHIEQVAAAVQKQMREDPMTFLSHLRRSSHDDKL